MGRAIGYKTRSSGIASSTMILPIATFSLHPAGRNAFRARRSGGESEHKSTSWIMVSFKSSLDVSNELRHPQITWSEAAYALDSYSFSVWKKSLYAAGFLANASLTRSMK